MIEIVAVDADDTLWDECSHFDAAEAGFVEAVVAWTGDVGSRGRLRALHASLIGEVGYGPAGYRVALHRYCRDHLPPARAAQACAIADALCDCLETASLTPFPGIADALAALARRYRLILISKGDVARQTAKLRDAGLAEFFHEVFVVPEKDEAVYAEVFGARRARPHAAMIGNSLKSDILPALAVGAFGLFVPSARTSPLEHAEAPAGHPLLLEFPSFPEASAWLLGGPRRAARD